MKIFKHLFKDDSFKLNASEVTQLFSSLIQQLPSNLNLPNFFSI